MIPFRLLVSNSLVKIIPLLELCNEKFLKGKRMWSYVDGTSVKPTEKKDEANYAKELET